MTTLAETNRLAHSRDMAERLSLTTRVVLWLFARRLNHDLFSRVISRAYERGVINSQQMHSLAAEFDPTQRGVVGLVTKRRKQAV